MTFHPTLFDASYLTSMLDIFNNGTDKEVSDYIDSLKLDNYDFLKVRPLFGYMSFRDFIEVKSRQKRPNIIQDRFYDILHMLPKGKSSYTRDIKEKKINNDDLMRAKNWNHLFNMIVAYNQPDNVHYALTQSRIFYNNLYDPLLVKRLIQSKILDVDEESEIYKLENLTTFRSYIDSLSDDSLTPKDIEIKKIINKLVPKADVKYCSFVFTKGPNADKVDCRRVVKGSEFCYLHMPRKNVNEVTTHVAEVVNNVIDNIVNTVENKKDEIETVNDTVINHKNVNDITINESSPQENVNEYEAGDIFVDSDFSELSFSCSEDESENKDNKDNEENNNELIKSTIQLPPLPSVEELLNSKYQEELQLDKKTVIKLQKRSIQIVINNLVDILASEHDEAIYDNLEDFLKELGNMVKNV